MKDNEELLKETWKLFHMKNQYNESIDDEISKIINTKNKTEAIDNNQASTEVSTEKYNVTNTFNIVINIDTFNY